MKPRHRIALAAATLLAAIASSGAHAQGVRVGDELIPESSIEYREDIGLRAHTNLHIFVGPGHGVGFDGGLGPGGGMTPAQLRSAYSLPSTGGSQIIAIVDAYDDPKALSDFNSFATQFGLPTETSTSVTSSTNKVFQVVYENGAKPPADSTGGWELEESLDIEWAHAMAPNAKIVLFEAASTSFSDLLTAVAAATSYVDGNGSKVKEVSCSWSSSEFSGENSYDSSFSSTNVVYFASAGDSGAPAGYPSASPYVVSAGGTTVNTNSSGAFTSEVAWNSGGGGPSAYETRPSFQSGISSIVGSWRGTPDLSYDANPSTGASVYDSYPYSGTSYTWWVVGGTSLSSPALAGVANLAATAAGSFPAGSQALLTTIYSKLGTANFRDITSGNNGYAAGTGWDFVTGVGSCVGLAGLQSGSSTTGAPTLTGLSPSSVTAGGPAFTLTVNGTGFVTGATISASGNVLTTTYVSSTQVTAAIPAAYIASAGTASITVANPGSAASNALTFTINNPTPVLSSISPNSATHGSNSVTITLTGSGFVSGSQVKWALNGTTTTLTTTYVSATKLTATVTSNLLKSRGTATVQVSNPTPGGGNSGSQSFTIN
jgi:subtilase family serine protease